MQMVRGLGSRLGICIGVGVFFSFLWLLGILVSTFGRCAFIYLLLCSSLCLLDGFLKIIKHLIND
jgi:hypothetical protein